MSSLLSEKCPYLKFFWSLFSRIRTEYVEIRVSLPIQSEYGKIRTKKTPNTDTFYAVLTNSSYNVSFYKVKIKLHGT